MKIVACYSNKGGVGKTAASVNLAYAFAKAGKRVLLCDLDPQGASGFYFRVKPSEKLENEAFFEDVKQFTKAIRGSDYDNLDILPANMTFRDFDVFLSRMKNSRSRLKKSLKAVGGDYDVIVLDCPPNISMLSENVLQASDLIVVPVIPTTLSERTFEQLLDFVGGRTGRRTPPARSGSWPSSRWCSARSCCMARRWSGCGTPIPGRCCRPCCPFPPMSNGWA
ncbi:ParA family protein [Paracoccus liaowanqingii]|uniref:ParA family protein n=1 Tax=Paracoccus liaowanqingii TaxID=2560053 RepID=UPI00159BB628|nr:AAA family ATPase [Paracoccus liaowanqingii]